MPTCPVCGFPELTDPPRGGSGGGSYEICPSCGFQFGVDDDDKGLTYEQARERWIAGGMKWHSRGKARPEHWSPEEQLAALTSGGKHAAPRAHPTPETSPKEHHQESEPKPEPPKSEGGKWWAPWKK